MQMDEETLGKAMTDLEEKLEYSNITDLRQDLLPSVERLQKTPALRFLIFKHSRPQAVLMSFQTYDLLRKVMNHVLGNAAGISRDQSIREAVERLHAERSADVLTQGMAVGATEDRHKEIKAIVGEVHEKMRRLEEIAG
jgi:hypothetical protein